MNDAAKIKALREALIDARDIIEEELANIRSSGDPEMEPAASRFQAAIEKADAALDML